MPDRRTFVASMLGASVSLPTFRPDAFHRLFDAGSRAGGQAPAETADDETYWGEIQRAFDIDRTMVNLNNGGCSPAPTYVLRDKMRGDAGGRAELLVSRKVGKREGYGWDVPEDDERLLREALNAVESWLGPPP
ncbi:MAG: hypothetical protein LH467_05425 [Gemmatimonadaceae bacterium]|nr:hypothetical protein [Gemmatimonadaceae bacterium]